MLYFDPSFGIFEQSDEIAVYSPQTHSLIKLPVKYKSAFSLIQKLNGMIDDTECEKLEAFTRTQCEVAEPEVRKCLIEAGFAFESQSAYHAAVEKVNNGRQVGAAQPRIAYLHLTQRCNLSCWYCYNKHARSFYEMDTKTWKSILNDLSKKGVRTINITGGESLLRDDLGELIEYASEKFQRICLLSNGTLLTEAFVKQYFSLLSEVIISLDSIDDLENASNRVGADLQAILSAIAAIRREGFLEKLSIRAVATKANIGSIARTRSVLKQEYGLHKFNVVRFLPNRPEECQLVPSDEDLQAALKGREDQEHNEVLECSIGRCGAGSGIIAIDADGGIYPCQSFVGKAEFLCGHILNPNWLDELNSSKVREDFSRLDVNKIEKCKACSVRSICGAGCPSVAYRLHGSIHAAPEILCPSLYMRSVERLFSVELRRLDTKAPL